MANFKERLNEAISRKKISAAELSRISKVNEGAISQYRKGAYKATQENLDRLAKALDVSVAWLMGYDSPSNIDVFSIPGVQPIPKIKRVPRLGTIACGEPVLAEQNIQGYDTVDSDVDCDFTLVCKGDSMINARIFDGDVVYIKQQPDVENGEIAAVLINDEATLKKVYKYPDKLVLMACNPVYDDFVYTADEATNIHILGKAVVFKSLVRHSK
jgi:repressor LexA